ncbi:hypothetical protein P167DRAFT_564101 [Morchella conica CCBAS932]|uniref:Uncharacterized protein n=1 Tax=Morchella conica CCBAS932 TaxID=1392247 RepID=A0A3N4KX89_9PEZI|nr:hypothetical protein P167DRAFT_564101 [Morchella conica CCBAS932]
MGRNDEEGDVETRSGKPPIIVNHPAIPNSGIHLASGGSASTRYGIDLAALRTIWARETYMDTRFEMTSSLWSPGWDLGLSENGKQLLLFRFILKSLEHARTSIIATYAVNPPVSDTVTGGYYPVCGEDGCFRFTNLRRYPDIQYVLLLYDSISVVD